jgi:hypothetical protein
LVNAGIMVMMPFKSLAVTILSPPLGFCRILQQVTGGVKQAGTKRIAHLTKISAVQLNG